jgi:23S rRNA pseudouridine1911/1915/1917 synthase
MIIPLFEDNHLLVLNKPPGLLTQPSGTDQDSLEQQAKAWIKTIYHKPGHVFLQAVHRLDKPVSGIVIFAKTSKALSRLNASMRAKQISKTYWAWVEGSIDSDGGILEHWLVHDEFHAKRVESDHPEGKVARLTYQVLQRKKGRTLLQIELATGRYHQIRLQFSASGHPVWGDRKYGGTQQYMPDAIALHHRCLQLPHPISQTWLMVEAPPPTAFMALAQDENFIL